MMKMSQIDTVKFHVFFNGYLTHPSSMHLIVKGGRVKIIRAWRA